MYSSTNSQVLSADGEMPIRLVTINGTPFWQASGRTFPVVAGAEDPPGDGKDGDGKPPASGDPKGGSGDSGGDDGDFDKDRALATIRKLREEQKTAKAQLRELDTLKSKQKEREDADKSEAEKLREQLADIQAKQTAAESKLQQNMRRQAVERAAAKAGAADPEDIFRLLDESDFDIDDEGAIKNADKLVEALMKAKPYLAGKTPPAPVPGTPRSNGQPGREEKVKEAEEKLIATRQYQPFG